MILLKMGIILVDTKTLTNDPTTFSIEVMPRTAKKVDDFEEYCQRKQQFMWRI